MQLESFSAPLILRWFSTLNIRNHWKLWLQRFYGMSWLINKITVHNVLFKYFHESSIYKNISKTFRRGWGLFVEESTLFCCSRKTKHLRPWKAINSGFVKTCHKHVTKRQFNILWRGDLKLPCSPFNEASGGGLVAAAASKASSSPWC